MPGAHPALDIFEFVYFARPDSRLYGRTLAACREEMGQRLAREAPADADLVMPVPESGVPAAIGYARESGIPYGEGLIKNHYVHRTFIQPDQHLRQLGIRMKLNPVPALIAGKRLVVVDDSIVRGNTMSRLVAAADRGGARRGARAGELAAGRLPVVLRHRHAEQGRADRRRPRRRRGAPTARRHRR